MNRALFTLLWLQHRSALRRAFRGVRTVRGALLVLFTIGLLALMIGPQVASAILLGERPELEQARGAAAPFAPLALLGFTMLFALTSAGEAAVSFTPAEVDVLFAAPFTRRELLLYKLWKTAVALLVLSGFLSVTMLMNFRSWPAGFVGLLLALGMVQLVGMATTLAGQIATEAAYTRARKAIGAVLVVAVIAGLGDAYRRASGQDLGQLAAHLRASPIFRVLLAPFEVFTRTMFAGSWFPELAGWGAAALAIDAGLLLIVLRLDADYIESAAAISQRVYERLRRARQGGGIAMPVDARAARLRLPPPPWMGGVGPIAWRQLLLAIRTSRHILITSGLIVGMGAVGSAFAPGPARGPDAAAGLAGVGTAMVFYLTFLFTMQLPWAFRGDVDHIDVLKSLPLRPALVATGELAGGVLLLTAMQWALLGILTAAAPSAWGWLMIAAAFCLPFNGLLFGLANLLFLLYPVRHPAGTTIDFQSMGRMSLFLFLQFLLMLPLLGVPAALAGAAYFLAGGSWTAFAGTAWVLLAAELVPLVLAVSWAFERFDVSTQTPA